MSLGLYVRTIKKVKHVECVLNMLRVVKLKPKIML